MKTALSSTPPSSSTTRHHVIQLPRQRLRAWAKRLLNFHSHASPTLENESSSEDLIKVVCISDTHNNQPSNLPPGDLLIHAGDLTEWGTFDEVQRQIFWLGSLTQYKHKVVIAGNHDTLFDPAFLETHAARFPVLPGKSKDDLSWGGVKYLENEGVSLPFGDRQLRLWGSPLTPKYLDSAFQYPRSEDVWTPFAAINTSSTSRRSGDSRNDDTPESSDSEMRAEWEDLDILITHGPPWGIHDTVGLHRAGCRFFNRAIETLKMKPRLVVCGHIHVGYGREKVRFDGVRRMWEEIEVEEGGWRCLIGMALRVGWDKICRRVCLSLRPGNVGSSRQVTEVVNAAVVGVNGEVCNEAIVVYL